MAWKNAIVTTFFPEGFEGVKVNGCNFSHSFYMFIMVSLISSVWDITSYITAEILHYMLVAQKVFYVNYILFCLVIRAVLMVKSIAVLEIKQPLSCLTDKISTTS